jgi:predicted phosphodiesterase
VKLALVALAACGSSADPAPPVATPVVAKTVVVDAAMPDAAAEPLRFVVLSDLHLPNPKLETAKIVAAVAAMHPRFVAIVGDFTNGSDKRDNADPKWWAAIDDVLAPLRSAKIPILPIAGNHDSYFAKQRALYAKNFADLASWTAPIETHANGTGIAGAPFSYSVDVDGVHFAFAHVVGGHLDPAVAKWLDGDLAAASKARLRVILGHVPMTSINGARQRNDALGKIAAAEHADLLIMGHEHLVWDEDVELPGGTAIREVVAGCSSGFYNYSPSPVSRTHAHCKPIKDKKRREPERCEMPHGGGAFELARGHKDRMLEHALATFTVVSIDGTTVTAVPMTVDKDGAAIPFYL